MEVWRYLDMGILVCDNCGSASIKVSEITNIDEYKWKEKYTCEDCGSTGRKIVDDNPKFRRPEIKHKGIRWEEEV